MNKPLPTNRVLSLLAVLLLPFIAVAQLPDFSLTATPAPQTCLGNGSLSFMVGGTQPGASLDYAVYLLPNTTTPVAIVTTTTVTGLVAGNYLVVATQSLGGESNTATANVTIANQVVPLQYQLTAGNVRCGNDGEIEVTVTSGTAVTYEITSGPVTVPPQASNVFTGLPAGLFQVRVYDNCGEAVVTSIQLVTATPGAVIGSPVLMGNAIPECDLLWIMQSVVAPAGAELFGPLTFQFTVYPPGGGAPIVINTAELPVALPFYEGQQYSYDLLVTDACGNTYPDTGNLIEPLLILNGSQNIVECADQFLTLQPENYMGPYTIEFLNAPAGFNPEDFNADHPVFNSDEVQYGDEDNIVPLGTYTIQITDACNRTATLELEFLLPEVDPQIVAQVLGCDDTGSLSIEIPGREIVSITITSAPAEYSGTLPDDVMEFVSGGVFFTEGLPLGSYTFEITDSCGAEYTSEAEIEPTTAGNVTVLQRPGCDEGTGSVRINIANSSFESVAITEAPAAFGQTLPFDVSGNIAANGMLFMNSLPEGTYTFTGVGECGAPASAQVVVQGYEVTQNDVEVIPHCGSFDINLHHAATGNYVQSFWLQKYYPGTGSWGHPQTGVVYPGNTIPNTGNSVALANNSITINLAYTGQFRIVKNFYVYSNGSSANSRCTASVYEFTFDGAPVITDAQMFPCGEGLTEVAIIATGVPPLTYNITTKNGEPFVINNGESNIFSELEPATYNFQVQDDCGNIRNIQFDINALDPIEIISEGFCEGEVSSLSVEQFSFLNYQWYEQSDPATILSTTNSLQFPSYNSATDAGTYIVSITTDNPVSCMNQVLQYAVQPNELPDAGADVLLSVCNNGGQLNLNNYLSAGHTPGGSWQDMDGSGALAGSMLTTNGLAEGTYNFRYTVSDDCGLSDEAIVTLEIKDIPAAPVVDAVAPVCEGSDIQLSVTEVAGVAYQWNGPHGFSSNLANPVITNALAAASGTYTVTATVNGCTSLASEVAVTVTPVAHAGEDATAALCNEGNTVDLTAYLSASHNSGGSWEDVNGSGALAGSMLDTDGLAQGTYNFRYTVTDACGGTDEAIVVLQINDIPAAPVAAAVAPVCEGADVQLSVAGVPGAVYTWTGPGSFSSADQNPLIPSAGLAASGNYQVRVTVNGCESPLTTVSVTVNPVPVFTVQGTAMLCEGQTGILSVEASNFPENDAAYTWYYNDGLLDGITSSSIEVLEPGRFTVVAEINGCTAEREAIIAENTNPFAVHLEHGCLNGEYTIWITNLSELTGAQFAWSGPGGYSWLGEQAVVTGLGEGEYSVTVTDADGCFASASVNIGNTSCMIPRGISPEDATHNNTFDLTNLGVKHIKIFNRYGLEVYEKHDYKNEWHGQSYRGELPAGTYYYVLTLAQGRQVTGWVYLQREY